MIERLFEDPRVVAVNVRRGPDGFQVHTRRADEGFRCAQARHATVEQAIAEHLPSRTNLSDLLA